jgi:hypothetical protein
MVMFAVVIKTEFLWQHKTALRRQRFFRQTLSGGKVFRASRRMFVPARSRRTRETLSLQGVYSSAEISRRYREKVAAGGGLLVTHAAQNHVNPVPGRNPIVVVATEAVTVAERGEGQR